MNINQRVVVRLSVEKEEAALYSYAVVHLGQVLYEGNGFTSIAAALREAVDPGQHIAGYEVMYGGYVSGTYSGEQLLANSDDIAESCVNTDAQFQAR